MSDADQRARRADAAARRLAQTEFTRPLLLEAGAGTGKTTVLVARIVAWAMGPGWERAEGALRKDARPSDIDPCLVRDRVAGEVLRRIVAITFTEAAAAEMAARVAEALVAIRGGELPLGLEPGVLPADGEESAARAGSLVASLDQLVVRTIHAWCRRLLAAHPLEAGLHPQFEVDADEELLAEVAREVVEAGLLAAYGEPLDEDYLALSSRSLGPADLEETLSALLRSATPPEALAQDPFAPERVRAFIDSLESALVAFRRVEAGCLCSVRGATRVVATAEAVGETIEALRGLRGDSVEDLRAVRSLVEARWPEASWNKLGEWARGKFGKVEPKALGAAVEALTPQAALLRRALGHARELDPDLLEIGRRVVEPLLVEAQRALRRRGVESYAALLRDTRELLARNPHTARRIRREIDQLLVDEFQDTDRIQCQILRSLAFEGEDPERPGLFLVGDPKQSIYGWRRADLRAYHEFAEDLRRGGGRRERLSVNFRSAPVILDEVRRVVEPIMRAEEGVQPQFEDLVPCEEQRDAEGFGSAGFAPVEHWVSWEWDAAAGAPLTGPGARDVAELEARALARDLAALHRAHGVPWRDIGLLFRNTGDLDIYLGALRELSIPYVVERDRSYNQRREIIEASALVRCVLDPHDHLALLTVLRCALVGVPDAALIPLWQRDFPARMAGLPEPGAVSDARAATLEAAASLPSAREIPGLERIAGWERNLLAWIEGLALLRRSFELEPADRFVEKLRTLLLFEATEASRYLGAYRLANLDRFFRHVVGVLEETGGDVSVLLARLRAAVSESREEEEGRPKDAADSAVQVMTIHKAKGLDFAHVYLMQMHKGHRGTAVKTPEPVERGGCWEYALFGAPTPGFGEAAVGSAAVESAERVRTLYVAMTRAKSRLVLAGKHPSSPPAPSSAGTHVDLVCQRSPSHPDLERSMTELGRRGEVAHLDGEGARWVFPALRAEDRPTSGTAASDEAAAEPSIEEIRASAQRLLARRGEASLREARPFRGVASDAGHEIDPEEALLRSYGAEDEGGGAVSGASPADPGRRVALAVGSAVHGALEIFDPGGDPEAEIARCRREIEGALSLMLGPADRAAGQARADDLLARFAGGPLLERLRRIGPEIIARELPILLPPREAGRVLPPGTETRAPVGFVSGAIDLLYRDPQSGAVVVADFKTDRVEHPDEIRERAHAYAGQGGIYLRGIREALDLEGDFRFELWFLHPGRIELVPV